METEARASVDRAKRAVLETLAFEMTLTPAELEALTALTLACEALLVRLEAVEETLAAGRVLIALADELRETAREEIEGWDAHATLQDIVRACERAAEGFRS